MIGNLLRTAPIVAIVENKKDDAFIVDCKCARFIALDDVHFFNGVCGLIGVVDETNPE